ncbi:hypothetical protein TNCV_5069321, partial [Trichonephila clavipes]
KDFLLRMNKIRKTTAVLDSPTVILKEFVAEIFFMLYNHTTWPLSIFCIMKIHRLGPGSNPPPCVEKASDKPTTPPSGLVAVDTHYGRKKIFWSLFKAQIISFRQILATKMK